MTDTRKARHKRRATLRGYLSDSLQNSIRSRHKAKHGTKCDLTVEDLLEIYNKQQGLCYWTRLPLQWGDSLPNAHPYKLSFDQLNPGEGYTRDNVVLASNLANRARGNTPAEEFNDILNTLRSTL